MENAKTLKEITINTKAGKQTLTRSKVALNASVYGDGDNLYSVYNRPSISKIEADKGVQAMIDRLGGYGVSYRGNTFTFSVTFNFVRGGVEYRAYITACNNRFYPIGATSAPDTAPIEDEPSESQNDKDEKYLADFKKRYDNLTPDIKKRLADSGITITSLAQAEQVMKISESFSMMERLFAK
jgi:hypothetical protein